MFKTLPGVELSLLVLKPGVHLHWLCMLVSSIFNRVDLHRQAGHRSQRCFMMALEWRQSCWESPSNSSACVNFSFSVNSLWTLFWTAWFSCWRPLIYLTEALQDARKTLFTFLCSQGANKFEFVSRRTRSAWDEPSQCLPQWKRKGYGGRGLKEESSPSKTDCSIAYWCMSGRPHRDRMPSPKVKRSIRLVLALYLMHKQCDLRGCNCIVRAKEQACAFSADSWQGERHVVRKERGKANKITANAQRSAGVLLA